MIDSDTLYQSWVIEGSYFNQMLDCGNYYNQSVQFALEYLPEAVLDEYKEKLMFISTAQRAGCRLARNYCENREVILLSERVLPKHGANEEQPGYRYFIYVVLHEVAHAVRKHKSPKFDNLTDQENQMQEEEAQSIAMEWFNQHVETRKNQFLKPITKEEIEEIEQKNIRLMENLYAGG